jgi:molybdopterin-guanine dinucleotide biosynthesis protein A
MTLTAVLFVGGRSRRMGADKATLDIAGEPLWRKQIKLLRELQPQSLCISARERPAWCPPEIETVMDEPPSRGPLSGVAAALQRLQTSHLLALAIDLPQMTTDELRKLWALAEPGCGVVPTNGDFFEPLCAIYPAEAGAVAMEALAGNDVSLQNFSRLLLSLNLVRTHALTESEKPLFLNVNSPADLQAIQRRE